MIGIFGGTFDPIHHGHLRVALDVLEALQLAQVRFLPLQQAVHREQPQADAPLRLAMLQAALAAEPRFVADDRELRRGGASFTVDTLRSLRQELGEQVPLCLLLGSDAFNGFGSWREPETILTLAHLIIMQRPGCQLPTDPALQQWVSRHGSDQITAFQQAPAGRIRFQPVTQLDITATDIRHRIAQGRSARYLTPDPVLALLADSAAYRVSGP